MRVILATGLNTLEKELEKYEGFISVYNRAVLTDIVSEIKPDAVLLSPRLKGQEDLIKTVVIPLREQGARIVFLPGDIQMEDTKEWLRRLLPWGVYCYVFDPVTPEKVINRLHSPGNLKDIPKDIASSISDKEVANYLHNTVLEDVKTPTPEPKKKWFILKREKENSKPDVKSSVSTVQCSEEWLSIKNAILIDLSGNATIKMESTYSTLWKADWRLGLNAEPVKLPSNSLFYAYLLGYK